MTKLFRTSNKRIAERMERDWRRELHSQAYLGQKERITIREAVDQFCESKNGTANHRNLVIHSRTLDRLFRTNRYLDEITSKDLETLKQSRYREGCSPSTLQHTFNLIRGSWKYARKLGYRVSEFEFPEIKLPKYRLRYLSVEEEKRLLTELNPRREVPGLSPYENRSTKMIKAMEDNYDLVVLLLDAGARHSEIANLEWRNVNLEDQTIHLWRPKVQNESVLYMTDRVHRILTRRFHEKQFGNVFPNRTGEKRGYSVASIRKAFRRAGLNDCTVHTLRHTHASRLIQNGMSLYEVKEILGHSDIKTTLRYAHLERQNVTSKARDVINKLTKDTEKPDLKIA